MDLRDLDQFVANVVNEIKSVTEHTRQNILNGDLDLDAYRKESGVLLGYELAVQILIDEANKTIERETK